MRKIDVVKYFGSQRKIAHELGVSEQAVSMWGEVIPEKNALRLHQLTKGDLEYNGDIYRQERA